MTIELNEQEAMRIVRALGTKDRDVRNRDKGANGDTNNYSKAIRYQDKWLTDMNAA